MTRIKKAIKKIIKNQKLKEKNRGRKILKKKLKFCINLNLSKQFIK